MQALIIVGSRTPEGQTGRAARALGTGLMAAGVDVETVYLPERCLERCRQCEADGWGLCRSEGRCVIDDDFAGLVDRLAAADIAAFATPVYWSDLSESLRALLDRLRRTGVHESGKARVAGTPAVGLCVAGGGGGGAPACAVSLDKVLTTCGFDTVDMVLARRQNLDLKLDLLETTGRWLARYAAARSAAD